MAKQGTVRRWDAEKGFGFIRSLEVSADVFFHISTFKCQAGLLPHEGLAVQFEEVFVGGKGFKATRVIPVVDRRTEQPAGLQPALRQKSAQTGKPLALAPKRTHPSPYPHASNIHRIHRVRAVSCVAARQSATKTPSSRLGAFLLLLLLWAGLLVYGLISQRFSFWVLPGMAALNVITLFAYAFDKSAAESGKWRTNESTLHLFALAGGWPVAWMAQQILRHKTSKHSFQSVYWATAALHCSGLAAWVFGLQEQLARHLN